MTFPRSGVQLGAHMSIDGGPHKALLRGELIGCDAIQMFTRSNSRWHTKALAEKQIEAFHVERARTGIKPIMAHCSYLINLGNSEDAMWQKSLEALVTELNRCHQLGIDRYVLHPGSHGGHGEDVGLERIALGLRAAIERTPDMDTRILLETMAGQGNGLGYRFEHLAWLLKTVNNEQRLGVCFDTAHVFAAGYDLRTSANYAGVWQAFDETIGIDKLYAIHLNDSKRDLGSRVDRHQHIGQGLIGVEAFGLLVNDHRLAHVPMVLETPKDKHMAEDIENLALLRSMILSD